MKPATRLDPLVRLKERDEKQAQITLATALRALKEKEERVAALRVRSRIDDRATAPAQLWDLSDQAHAKALRDLAAAQEAVKAAEKVRDTAREALVLAKRKVETFRRASERERAEIVRETERKERKSLEEMAALLFHRD